MSGAPSAPAVGSRVPSCREKLFREEREKLQTFEGGGQGAGLWDENRCRQAARLVFISASVAGEAGVDVCVGQRLPQAPCAPSPSSF